MKTTRSDTRFRFTGLDVAYLSVAAFGWPYLAYLLMSKPKYRAGLREKLGSLEPRKGSLPCVWVHGVSVGEILSVQPLVATIRERMPDWEVVLSTTTYTGREVAGEKYPGLRIFHFPFDFSWVVEKAFRRIRPSCIVLVEGELWPNFLRAASLKKAPVAVVNGRLSEKSVRGYSLLRRLLGPGFPAVRLWCVQSEREAEQVRRLGVREEALIRTGNLKYDRVFGGDAADAPQEIRKALGGGVVLIAGSTHPGEDEAILWAFERLGERFPDVRLVLAPRHPERWDEVERLIGAAGFEALRRTRLTADSSAGRSRWVLLLDSMGELNSIYSLADVVFVGGSLVPIGGHNLLEPASAGKPILFGPHTFKSADIASDMQAGGGGYMVSGKEELLNKCIELLSDRERAAEIGRKARAVVEANIGAVERTFQALRPLTEEAVTRATGG